MINLSVFKSPLVVNDVMNILCHNTIIFCPIIHYKPAYQGQRLIFKELKIQKP